MWSKSYKDYPKDTPLKKEQVHAGKGIVGCEMHELNGWSSTLHYEKDERNKGWLRTKLKKIWGR